MKARSAVDFYSWAVSNQGLEWELLTNEERERAYSPSSCVGGDIEPFLSEYERSSDESRRWCEEQGLVLQTLRYGVLDAHTVDLAVPDSPEPVPLVVYIHGGYWQQLSKLDSFGPARDFLDRGVAYAAVDYTLAPAASLDEIVQECRHAVAMLRAEASGLNVDTSRIVLAGSSAGAHLAAMVATDPDSATRPAAMVLLSGVYELEPLIGTTINDAVGLDSTSAARNSPARIPIEEPPAAVIAYGDNETDQFKRQSGLCADRLADAGGVVLELEIEGRNHFDIVGDLGSSTVLGQAVAHLIDSTKAEDAQL